MQHNPISLASKASPELEAAIEDEALSAAAAVRARRRVELLMMNVSSATSTFAAESPKERDLTGPELDRAMGWSAAHRRRLGLVASYFAGDGERSPRFHLEDVRRQLADRGPQPTKATPKKTISSVDNIDVTSALTRSGLRAVAGGGAAR